MLPGVLTPIKRSTYCLPMDGAMTFADYQTGELDRLDVADEWTVPRLTRQGDRLEFEVLPGGRGTLIRPHPRHGLLRRFVTLADASDTAIESYARRWGPLTTCEHRDSGWLHRIRMATDPDFSGGPVDVQPLKGSGPKVASESLEDWRAVSRRAKGFLAFAGRVRMGVVPDDGMWRAIAG